MSRLRSFLVGWYIFGLLGAVILAIIVMFLMGIIKISSIPRFAPPDPEVRGKEP
jgi:Co/Zn/Cd efflux system component